MLVLILPVVYAASSVQEALQQQISNQIVSGQNMPNINMDPQELLMKAILEDPQMKAAFMKFTIFMIIFVILIVIDFILKGFAMWRASKNDQKIWFWLLLVISSMGILPLIYLLISKKPQQEKKKR